LHEVDGAALSLHVEYSKLIIAFGGVFPAMRC
jgi:hypothetical protein